MAQKKKTTARSSSTRTRTSGRSNTHKKTKEEIRLQREVTLIVAFALCVLLFLCNLGLIGVVGKALSNIMKGFFGVVAYIFPVILFAFIIFCIGQSGNPNTFRKIKQYVCVLLIFLNVVAIIDLITGISKNVDTVKVADIFRYGIDANRGGGVIAGLLNYALVSLLATVGTAILEVIVIFICLILLTDGAFVDLIKNSGQYIKEKSENSREAREEIYREKEYNREVKRIELERRREEEERLMRAEEESSQKVLPSAEEVAPTINGREIKKAAKEDKKIIRKSEKFSGVSTDTEIVKRKEASAIPGNMHEITLNGFNERENTFDDSVFTQSSNEIFTETVAPVIEEPVTVYEDEIFPVIKETEKPKPAPVKVPSDTTVSSSDKQIKEETITPVPVRSANPGVTHVYKFPPIELLKENKNLTGGDGRSILEETATKLVETLKIFGVDVRVDSISQGPTVTRYELQPAPGTKVSRIKSLTDDIKLSLATSDIRIEAPVPGKSVIGIEVPNKTPQSVLLRDIVDTPAFRKETSSNLTFSVGKDIGGNVVVYDIDQFPHLLIAGSTGSGKSVCINSLIVSIIYKCHPDDVKLLMIDPKVVELRVYNGIPHLLTDVVTDAKKAAGALNAAVNEMMERYKKFADANVRDLKGYNEFCQQMVNKGESPDLYKKLPRIIVIVDELADLMMVAKNEVEDSICRLAQLARACGIHLIVATQRPSVDVITGLIKANMPSRIAFSVASNIDSRTILDMGGAEELLGKGDMLFFPKGLKKPVRLQGPWVSDEEVNAIVDFLKPQAASMESSAAEFEQKITAAASSSGGGKGNASQGSDQAEFDELFMDVAYYIIDSNKASIGNLQRKFKVGFNRAARIMDKLAEIGVVSGDEGTKGRTVLMNREEFENYIEENGM